MIELTAIEEQIKDTKELIDHSTTLMDGGDDDAALMFMINQDKLLLEDLHDERKKLLIDSFKSLIPDHIETPNELISYIHKKNYFGSIDPFQIANHFGIKIIKDNSLSHGIGKCIFDGDKIIITYRPEMEERDRFTLAHELGHVFLHFSKGLDTIFEDQFNSANNSEYMPVMQAARDTNIDEYKPLEAQANEFAGQLLLPKYMIDKIMEKVPHGQKIKASLLKNQFKVSSPVVRIRLEKYGYASSDKIEFDI